MQFVAFNVSVIFPFSFSISSVFSFCSSDLDSISIRLKYSNLDQRSLSVFILVLCRVHPSLNIFLCIKVLTAPRPFPPMVPILPLWQLNERCCYSNRFPVTLNDASIHSTLCYDDLIKVNDNINYIFLLFLLIFQPNKL